MNAWTVVRKRVGKRNELKLKRKPNKLTFRERNKKMEIGFTLYLYVHIKMVKEKKSKITSIYCVSIKFVIYILFPFVETWPFLLYISVVFSFYFISLLKRHWRARVVAVELSLVHLGQSYDCVRMWCAMGFFFIFSLKRQYRAILVFDWLDNRILRNFQHYHMHFAAMVKHTKLFRNISMFKLNDSYWPEEEIQIKKSIENPQIIWLEVFFHFIF